jgi:hypothetical protein
MLALLHVAFRLWPPAKQVFWPVHGNPTGEKSGERREFPQLAAEGRAL